MTEPYLKQLEVTAGHYALLKDQTTDAARRMQTGPFGGVTVLVNPILPDGFEIWRWSDGLFEFYRRIDGRLIWRHRTMNEPANQRANGPGLQPAKDEVAS